MGLFYPKDEILTFNLILTINIYFLKNLFFRVSRNSELKIRLSADKFDTRKVADFYPRLPFFVFLTMFKSIYIGQYTSRGKMGIKAYSG